MLRSLIRAIVVVLASVLEFDRAVEVEEVEIVAEPGRLRLRNGVLVPIAALEVFLP
jgi:hypothetical protein